MTPLYRWCVTIIHSLVLFCIAKQGLLVSFGVASQTHPWFMSCSVSSSHIRTWMVLPSRIQWKMSSILSSLSSSYPISWSSSSSFEVEDGQVLRRQVLPAAPHPTALRPTHYFPLTSPKSPSSSSFFSTSCLFPLLIPLLVSSLTPFQPAVARQPGRCTGVQMCSGQGSEKLSERSRSCWPQTHTEERRGPAPPGGRWGNLTHTHIQHFYGGGGVSHPLYRCNTAPPVGCTISRCNTPPLWGKCVALRNNFGIFHLTQTHRYTLLLHTELGFLIRGWIGQQGLVICEIMKRVITMFVIRGDFNFLFLSYFY